MIPTLLEVGPLAISTLGFFTALAFFTGTFMVWKKGKEENFDESPLFDGLILATISAIVGGRVFYILANGAVNVSWAINFFKHPGFSYFGCLAGGLAFMVYYAKKRRWDFYKLGDVLVFGIVPAQIIIRIGNFLEGSFYGKSTGLPWAIAIPGVNAKVHPVSLYEIFFLLLVLFLIKKLERTYRLFDWYKNKRGQAAPGFLFLTYILVYSSFRFLLEFASKSSIYWYGFSWEQYLSSALILTTLILFYLRSGKDFGQLVYIIRKLLNGIIALFRHYEIEVLVPLDTKKKTEPKQQHQYKTGLEAKN